MKLSKLWKLMRDIVVQCLQNPNGIDSPDDIMEDLISSCPSISNEEAEFVREVVSGALHFERVCEGAFNGYCDCKRRSRADKKSLYIVAYLMMFRYTEVGGYYLRQLLYHSTTASRLLDFLGYLIDVQALLKYSGPYWDKYYDSGFITTSVVQPLEEIAPHVRVDVIEWLERKFSIVAAREAHEGDAGVPRTEEPLPPKSQKSPPLPPAPLPQQEARRPGRIPPAEVREMLFTIPEPRLPRIDCSKPPPPAARHAKPPTRPIGFSFTERSPSRAASRASTGPAASAQDTPRVTERCDVQRVKEMLSRSVSVRMTAAALRREANTHAQRVAAQRQQYADVEATLCDERAYVQWQCRERRGEDERREKRRAERRAEAASAAARLAEQKRCIAAQNRAATQEVRAAAKIDAKRLRGDADSAVEDRRAAAERIRRACDENPRRAAAAAQRVRNAVARGVRAEAQQIRSDAREEAERTRMQQLVAIRGILQLRARNRQRREAPAVCRAAALQREESKADSKALREEESRAEAQRRERITAERAAQVAEADALANACAEARRERRRERDEMRKEREAAEAERIKKREAREAQRAAEVSEALRARRVACRAESDALHAAERRRRNEMLLLGRDINAVEEGHWQQQELGLINRTTKKQNELFHSGFRQKVM